MAAHQFLGESLGPLNLCRGSGRAKSLDPRFLQIVDQAFHQRILGANEDPVHSLILSETNDGRVIGLSQVDHLDAISQHARIARGAVDLLHRFSLQQGLRDHMLAGS